MAILGSCRWVCEWKRLVWLMVSDTASLYSSAACHLSSTRDDKTDPTEFHPRKVLLLSKVSRYEYERSRYPPDISEVQFESALQKRGSDYSAIKHHYQVHRLMEERLKRALEAHGVTVKRVQRHGYNDSALDWADLVFTAGGDGTFLLGATMINNRVKPIVGLNTDPTRSCGHLLLPKNVSSEVEKAVELLLSGSFRWMFRRRIRVTLEGDANLIHQPAVELHKQVPKYPEYRYMDFLHEANVRVSDHPMTSENVTQTDSGKSAKEPSAQTHLARRVLPILALNEVFLGESLSSRVSHLEIRFDNDSRFIKTRNSGLCVSTGTGSSSWTYNINKMTPQCVMHLLDVFYEESNLPRAKTNGLNPDLIDRVTRRFNNDLLLHPELDLLSYTIRDPIEYPARLISSGGVGEGVGSGRYQGCRRPRGKVRKIEVKSRCFDACLVIDGSLSYRFNDGTKAFIDTHDADALRTIQIVPYEKCS